MAARHPIVADALGDTGPDDRRSVLVELTPAGHELIDRASTDMLDAEAVLIDTLDETERESLSLLLARLAEGLERRHDSPPAGRRGHTN